MKAKRLTPSPAELPAMPPPTMAPMFLVVAFYAPKRKWLIVSNKGSDFEANAVRAALSRRFQHARVYTLDNGDNQL